MLLAAQSQEFGQTGILAFPHLRRMSGQQMIFPGLARLGLLQKKLGQEGVLLAKLLLARIPVPATVERVCGGVPPEEKGRLKHKSNSQQMLLSKDVLGGVFGGW